MKLEIRNKNGDSTGRHVDLDARVFAVEANDHAVYLAVKHYMANQRQGTHKAKGRSEVAGSRKKLRKQKGAGAARVGDIKNPLFRGGGRVFGPMPRSYSFKINKKVKVLAQKSALTYKASSEKIVVVEDFDFDKPSTSTYAKFIRSVGGEAKVTLVQGQETPNVVLSSRNLKKAHVTTAERLNVYEIMHADFIVFSESALDAIGQRLNK